MISHPNVKINLGLSVIRKRADGYHELETLFVPYFGFSDTLEIITGDQWSETSASLFERYRESQIAQAISPDGSLMITIARREGVDWDPLSDLTARAYFTLAEQYKLPPVKIFLEKSSPVGAGLGGGSSDAAFAVRLIAELAGLGLSDAQMAEVASRLGSDCAFFIYNRPMIGRGRGEILTPYDLEMGGLELRVAVPEGVSVSTAEAYRGIVPRSVRPVSALPLLDALSMPVGKWRQTLSNDFETTVLAAHPEIAALKQKMYDEGAIYASMSGSGSSVFGIYRSPSGISISSI